MSRRVQMREEPEHLLLAAAETALGIDVQDGERHRGAHAGGGSRRPCVASQSLA